MVPSHLLASYNLKSTIVFITWYLYQFTNSYIALFIQNIKNKNAKNIIILKAPNFF